MMLYDIPGRTGTKLAAVTLAALAEHERIVAVKEASGDLYAGSWLLASTDLVLYSGDDALNLAWLALGAVGVVSVVGHLAGCATATSSRRSSAATWTGARRSTGRCCPRWRRS